MRKLIALALCILAIAGLASPAVAADRGSIVGRAINATIDKPARGVEVELVGAHRDGERRLRRTVTTAEDGRYRFTGLPTGDEWLYVVDARFEGGLFPGSPIRIPADTRTEPVLDTTLRVWNTTDDPATVIVERNDLFVVPGEEGVAVVEAVTIVNPTNLAYVGRSDRGREDSSSFGFALPAEAGPVRIEDATLDVPALQRTDFGVAITTAIPPDRTRITYSYTVPTTAGTSELTRPVLYPTADLTVHAEPPVDIAGNRFNEGKELELGGTTYKTWILDGRLDAGDPLQIVATAQAGIAPGLVAGAVGAALVLVILLVATLRRGRRKEGGAGSSHPTDSRDDLIAAIAQLDVDFENGRVGQTEWERKRAVLRARLEEHKVHA